MNKPTDDVLTFAGTRVSVAFMPGAVSGENNLVAIMLPMFNGINESSRKRAEYAKAYNVVRKRLLKLGYAVDG